MKGVKVGDPAFEKCVKKTAEIMGVRTGEVRAIIYKKFPFVHPRFGALPDEIVQKIILEMDPYDVPLFCAVSKRFRSICDEGLWKALWEKHVSPKMRRMLEPTRGDRSYQQMLSTFMKTGQPQTRTITIPKLGHLEYASSLDRRAAFQFNPETRELRVPRGVQKLKCERLQIKRLRLPEGLKRLECSLNPLENLDIPESLRYLDAAACNLIEIHLKNLTYANLHNNRLSSVQVHPAPRTKKKGVWRILDLSYNQLTYLDLRKTRWKSVILTGNKLKKLFLPQRGGIHRLEIDNNQLEVLVVPAAVRKILCYNNPWKKIFIAKSTTNKMKKDIERCVQDPARIFYYSKPPDQVS